MTTNSVSGHSMTLTCEGDVLGGARGVTLSFSQGTIDVTSADSSWWGEYISGRRDATIDVDALYIYNDVAKKVLQNHMCNQSPATITCIVTMPDAATFTGEGIVTSLVYTGPHEDALTAAASIQITDGLTCSTS
jgi:predicted secreted protein